MTQRFDKPFFLGFDQLERAIASANKAGADNYPPYDVIDCGDGRLQIVIAVAGFAEEDLNISVEGDELTVAGRKQTETDNDPAGSAQCQYLHKGISARQFKRRFLLGRGMEVLSADLTNGLLSLTLRQRVIDPAPIEIKITRS